jgi:hypothetical protein
LCLNTMLEFSKNMAGGVTDKLSSKGKVKEKKTEMEGDCQLDTVLYLYCTCTVPVL